MYPLDTRCAKHLRCGHKIATVLFLCAFLYETGINPRFLNILHASHHAMTQSRTRQINTLYNGKLPVLVFYKGEKGTIGYDTANYEHHACGICALRRCLVACSLPGVNAFVVLSLPQQSAALTALFLLFRLIYPVFLSRFFFPVFCQH